MREDVIENAQKIGKLLHSENSQQNAIDAFHRYLPLDENVFIFYYLFSNFNIF
jgi:hypothetical protein